MGTTMFINLLTKVHNRSLFSDSHNSTGHVPPLFHLTPGLVNRISHQVSPHSQCTIILFHSLRATCPAQLILQLKKNSFYSW